MERPRLLGSWGIVVRRDGDLVPACTATVVVCVLLIVVCGGIVTEGCGGASGGGSTGGVAKAGT